jgi:hypothetical protein
MLPVRLNWRLPLADYQPRATRIGDSLFEWGGRTYIMGILNLTPDSFSGDGFNGDVAQAVENLPVQTASQYPPRKRSGGLYRL